MSKIGKRTIELPTDVAISTEGSEVVVSGPKGRLSWHYPEHIVIEVKDRTVTVAKDNDAKEVSALHGLARALIANMVKGVSEGFVKQLKLVGVGYRAELSPSGLRLSLGFSHPIDFPAPPEIAFTVDKNVITIAGVDRQLVGETAARLRALKKPEPYKGKGLMYVDEQIRRKPGKAVKQLGGAPGAAA